MADIKINRKEARGYVPYFTENYANNIVNINLYNSRYDSTTALKTIQYIANTTIAPDGAYWQDITDNLEFESGGSYYSLSHDINLCCCDDVVFMIGGTSSSSIKTHIMYNYNCGKSVWTHQDFIYIPPNYMRKIVYYPTVVGYRLIITLTNGNGFDMHHLVIPYRKNRIQYDLQMEKYYGYPQCITETPYGFLTNRYDNLILGALKFYIGNYLYTSEQIDEIYTQSAAHPSMGSYFKHVPSDNYIQIPLIIDGRYGIDMGYDEKFGVAIMAYMQGSISCYVMPNLNKIDSDTSFLITYPTSVSGPDYMLRCVSALHRNFICYGSWTDKFKYYGLLYVDKTTDGAFKLSELSLPDQEHDWVCFFGNYYRLYAISSYGEVAYLNDINGDWHIANQDIEMDINTESSDNLRWQTLKSLIPSGYKIDTLSKFATDNNNTYIVGYVRLISGENLSTYKIIRTDVCNIQ